MSQSKMLPTEEIKNPELRLEQEIKRGRKETLIQLIGCRSTHLAARDRRDA